MRRARPERTVEGNGSVPFSEAPVETISNSAAASRSLIDATVERYDELRISPNVRCRWNRAYVWLATNKPDGLRWSHAPHLVWLDSVHDERGLGQPGRAGLGWLRRSRRRGLVRSSTRPLGSAACRLQPSRKRGSGLARPRRRVAIFAFPGAGGNLRRLLRPRP